MSKVSDDAVREGYLLAKRVDIGKLTHKEGQQLLVDKYSLNRNTAADIIRNVRHLLHGEKYVRKNNAFGTDHFLKMIYRDFGTRKLAEAVQAVEKHLIYYRNVPSGSDQPQIRKILEKYQRILGQDLVRDRDGLTRRQRDEFSRNEKTLNQQREFEPTDVDDARERVVASIVRRQGQAKFRSQLLNHYRRRCAISGCCTEVVLEAAHILPYKGKHTNHPSNGLLLRADLHTLFDLGLITIDSRAMKVLVSATLKETSYMEFHGGDLALPAEPSRRPSAAALDDHRTRWDPPARMTT